MTEVNFRKYCVLWGDPANRDLDDEYFNEKTDFGFKEEDLPVEFPVVIMFDFQHVQEVGFAEISRDRYGLIADIHLDPENDALNAVSDLLSKKVVHPTTWADEGKFGVSRSECVEKDGHIKFWPIKQILITSTPRDFRLIYGI